MVKTTALARLAVVAATLFCLFPTKAFADLSGPVTLNWYYPNLGTLYQGPVSIGVGSTFSCPLGFAVPFCSAYGEGGDHSFAVGPDSITYTGSGDPYSYNSVSANEYVFSGLAFTGGATLANFSLFTNISGLTASDVTFGPSSIGINMAGVPISGTVTLTLTATPEPAFYGLLALGLSGLFAVVSRRKKAQNA